MIAASKALLRNHGKLLSHRGRGFGYPEATLQAVRQALKSGVRYLEIDTRVDAEGVIYCYHHTRILTRTGLSLLRESRLEAVALRGLPRLDEMLRVVAEVIEPDQRLCLDIKDYGFEQSHVEMVEHLGLASNIVFVSWIPHTLQRIYAICNTYPLVLSHINLQFLWVGANVVERLLDQREIRVFDFILIGPRSLARPLAHRVGFHHGLFCVELPKSYVRMLQDSQGGICVPYFCLCDSLDAWCEAHHLQQWVFTVNNEIRYSQLVDRKAIDVVFSDDPIRMASQRRFTTQREERQ